MDIFSYSFSYFPTSAPCHYQNHYSEKADVYYTVHSSFVPFCLIYSWVGNLDFYSALVQVAKAMMAIGISDDGGGCDGLKLLILSFLTGRRAKATRVIFVVFVN